MSLSAFTSIVTCSQREGEEPRLGIRSEAGTRHARCVPVGPPGSAGHQRTIITIQEQYLSEWLSPAALSRQRLEHILSDKELPYYVHQIAA